MFQREKEQRGVKSFLLISHLAFRQLKSVAKACKQSFCDKQRVYVIALHKFTESAVYKNERMKIKASGASNVCLEICSFRFFHRTFLLLKINFCFVFSMTTLHLVEEFPVKLNYARSSNSPIHNFRLLADFISIQFSI